MGRGMVLSAPPTVVHLLSGRASQPSICVVLVRRLTAAGAVPHELEQDVPGVGFTAVDCSTASERPSWSDRQDIGTTRSWAGVGLPLGARGAGMDYTVLRT
jgi:hypothetical protein